MIVKKLNIFSGGVGDFFVFDKTSKSLSNLGGLKESSLKSAIEVFSEELQDGTLKQNGVGINGECELMQTAAADLSLYDGAIGKGVHLWIVSNSETAIIKDTDFTIGSDGKFTRKSVNSAKLVFKLSGKKLTDVLWKMQGLFDPSSVILLLNPSLQKNVSETKILDCSNYDRSGTWSGMSTANWHQDKVSLSFDGVNDYISFADSEFRGAEMLGGVDSNNRTFETGIGNWTKQNANDTFASAAGGQSGNGGKLTVGAGASTTFMKLPADIQSLIVGESYHLQLQLKYETAWSGSYVNIAIGGCSKRILPTTNFQLFSFDFIANTVNPEIVMSALSGLTAGNILWIDEVSLTTSSQANLNAGERIFSATSREFEGATTGNWTGNGNHSIIGGETGRAGGSDSAIKIVSSGAGNNSANFVGLASSYYAALVAAKKYTIEFWVKTGTAGINVTACLGTTGQTKTFTGITNGVWTKCVWNILAGANDVNKTLEIYLSATDATGTVLDDVSISEAFDATLVAWVKRNGNPSADEKVVSKYASGTSGYWFGTKSSTDKSRLRLHDDTFTATVDGSTTVITDNVYHLLVATITREGNLQMYIDAGVDNGLALGAVIGKVLNANAVRLGVDSQPLGYYNGQVGTCEILRGKVWSQQDVIDYFNSMKAVYGL